MKIKEILEYHFKIEPKMKQKLIYMAKKRNQSLSSLINSIVDASFSVLEYFDFRLQSQKINNREEKSEKLTEDIWYYANAVHKNKLFSIQRRYQLQSKAKVLRIILRKYLKLIEKREKAEIQKFMKQFQQRWEKIKNRKRVWEGNMPHMWHISPYNVEIYDDSYRLLRIVIP